MKTIMSELNETVTLMSSADYKERFKAEYWQTKIRYEKLKTFCDKIEIEAPDINMSGYVQEPEHDCSYELLRKQQAAMGQYLHILELRAIIEDVEL